MDAHTQGRPAAALGAGPGPEHLTAGILGAAWVGPPGLSLANTPTELATTCDVAPFLKDRKAVKLMSTQDRLALAAAAAAVKQAGLGAAELHERTGIYLAVGMLPFEQGYLELIAEKSEKDGRFDMERFSQDAFQAMNPLLTFKCLPNMPVFHISFNLGVRGPYFVTYPGVGQWFRALSAALEDLEAGRVDFALVGAVADQRNALVRHHASRVGGRAPERLVDSACVLVLAREGSGERAPGAAAAPRARLSNLRVSYAPADPFAPESYARAVPTLPIAAGPVEPALAIALRIEAGRGQAGPKNSETLRFHADDGTSAELTLELTVGLSGAAR